MNEYLKIIKERGTKVIRCTCGQRICRASENYKKFVLLEETDIAEAGPLVGPPLAGLKRFVFRRFYCPGCLRVLETEVAQEGEPFIWDVQLLGP